MNDLSMTGLILAGGRGARMGGVDKGLQNFNGTPLTLHTLMRLQMQTSEPLSQIMVVANRNLSAYESFGVQVWPDSTDGFAGPLAGFLTGLERCETDLLLTVPCDSPLFPFNLAQRLLDTLISEEADITVAAAREEDGTVRAQPVFCLMRVNLLESWSSSCSRVAAKLMLGRPFIKPCWCRLTHPMSTLVPSSMPIPSKNCTASNKPHDTPTVTG